MAQPSAFKLEFWLEGKMEIFQERKRNNLIGK
jgi:hypothetical protein